MKIKSNWKREEIFIKNWTAILGPIMAARWRESGLLSFITEFRKRATWQLFGGKKYFSELECTKRIFKPF